MLVENSLTKKLHWGHYAEFISKTCKASPAAIALIEGAQLTLHYSHSSKPEILLLQNRAEAFELLSAPRYELLNQFNATSVFSEIFSSPHGTVAGAVWIFADTQTEKERELLQHFASHAEWIYELISIRFPQHQDYHARPEFTQMELAPASLENLVTEEMEPRPPALPCTFRFGEPSILRSPSSEHILFDHIFEQSILPILFWNTDGQLTDANQAAVALLGYPREEFLAGHLFWRKITPKAYSELDEAMFQNLLKHQTSSAYEKEFIRADRTRVNVRIVSSFLPGRKDEGIIFAFDITDRRIAERNMQRAQEALRYREQSLRMAIQATNLGTWDYNPSTKSLKWSRRCREIFGMSPRDLGPQGNFFNGVHPDDRKRIEEIITQTLDAQGSGNCDFEFRITRPCDQKERWVMVRAQALFTEIAGERRAYRLIGTILDITERKYAEAELRATRDAAEAANAAKDEFIAKLSHELRTPLTPVLMTLEMLLDRNDLESEIHSDLSLIYDNVQLESRLIDDLLDVTRISHGKLELHLEEANIHRVIEHAIGICNMHARKKQIAITSQLDALEHFTLCDPARLEQVFWNLLHNAVKFTPEGGRVQIRTSNPNPGQIAIAVADNGIGIVPEKIPTLFNAFEQGGQKVTRQFGGLGLGLTICQGIVQLHQGSIAASSKGIGSGATFTIQLSTKTHTSAELGLGSGMRSKRVSSAQGRSTNSNFPPSYSSTASSHVLLVEDHEPTAEILFRLLGRAGYQIFLAHSVNDAMRLLKRYDFALLISDIGLPDGSGLELMASIRASGKHQLPGIALSGFGTEQDIAASLAAGFTDHVIKPVEWKHLETVIRKLVK